MDVESLLGNAIGSFLGAKLGGLIYSPQTQAGEIGSAIGSAVGAFAAGSAAIGASATEALVAPIVNAVADTLGEDAGFLAYTVLPPGVGALVGFLLGALIGDLFGSKPKIPTASAQTVLAIPSASYQLGAQSSSNGGDLTTPVEMATLARDTLNGILQQITGVHGGTVQNTSSPTQAYGYDGSGLYVMLGANASKTYVSTADQAVDKGVLWALPQTQVIGGDIFLKRAVANTTAYSDVTTLMGNLQVASDYEFYVNNRALIDSEITAAYATLSSDQMSFYDNNKALVDQVDSQGVSSLNSSQQQTYNANAGEIGTIITALQAQSVANPWIITLQRASEIGLQYFAPSDFYGGLKGFLSSLVVGSPNPAFENFYAYWNGSTVAVDDQALPAVGPFSVLWQSPAGGNTAWIDASAVQLNLGGSLSSGSDFVWDTYMSSAVSINDTTAGNDILIGTNYNDNIQASGGGSVWLDGQGGDDYLSANGGAAVLLGGAGNDTLDAGSQSSGTYYLSGGAGNDTLTAHTGFATFVGGTGNDRETGASGKNAFIVDPSLQNGNASVSTLSISGTGGVNTLSFERFSSGVYLDLRNDDLTNPSQGGQQVATDTFQTFNGALTFSDIQNITGGSGNDWICTTAGMNSTLIGGAGDDTLHGWGGNDSRQPTLDLTPTLAAAAATSRPPAAQAPALVYAGA